MEPVKFFALDRDDLEVVSTHLQDALVKVSDIIWRPREKRLVVALSRFDWLSAEGTQPELRRCRAALRFERVSCCKCRNVDPAGKTVCWADTKWISRRVSVIAQKHCQDWHENPIYFHFAH